MIRNNKGVTLVELLIVIVILGIIAAISIPAVGNIVENSRKDAVLADAINLRNAATLCHQAQECDNGTFTDEASGQLEFYITIDVDSYSVTIANGVVTTVTVTSGVYTFTGDPTGATRGNVDDVE